MTTTIGGTTGVTFPDASTQNTAATGFGFKNRIINGAMVIDQRNAGASVTPANAATTYTLDRWGAYVNQASKLTVQQNAGSVTPPAGFKNYLGVTSSSAYSVSSGDILMVYQVVEGYNWADMAWGTADAAPVTISFWVRSSLTGTFGGALSGAASAWSYPFTYTISSANTWEKKTVTITGQTAGTWGATNGVGVIVRFSMGVGSTYLGTGNAWANTDYYGATGQTQVVGTSGATWYVTGVQLEKGSTATSFDYRPYSTELALCQRYYEIIGQNSTGGVMLAGGGTAGSQQINTTFTYKVSKRATPTVTKVGTWGLVNLAGQPITYGSDVDSFLLYQNISAAGTAWGQNNNTGNCVTISAEL
jgi:hypothetical protein